MTPKRLVGVAATGPAREEVGTSVVVEGGAVAGTEDEKGGGVLSSQQRKCKNCLKKNTPPACAFDSRGKGGYSIGTAEGGDKGDVGFRTITAYSGVGVNDTEQAGSGDEVDRTIPRPVWKPFWIGE